MEKELIRHTPSPKAEKIEFENGCPCRIRTRKNVTHEIGLPHYAPTVELVLTRGVRGVVSVGAKHFAVNGEDAAFFIPPQTVHYTEFERGDGSIHVFKLSPELLKDYMDLDKLLETKGMTLHSIPIDQSKAFRGLFDTVFHQITYEKVEFSTLRGVIELFERLCDTAPITADLSPSEPVSEKVRAMIEWTQAHLFEHISIEEAAAQLHYSKYHFCRLFKEETGVSYVKYVNNLKIAEATAMLREGRGATYCCVALGFGSLAYFAKLFKDVTGYTTSEYKRMIREEAR